MSSSPRRSHRRRRHRSHAMAMAHAEREMRGFAMMLMAGLVLCGGLGMASMEIIQGAM